MDFYDPSYLVILRKWAVEYEEHVSRCNWIMELVAVLRSHLITAQRSCPNADPPYPKVGPGAAPFHLPFTQFPQPHTCLLILAREKPRVNHWFNQTNNNK